jgi:hypothetical protein
MAGDGSAQIEGTSTVSGVAAADYRTAYQTPGSRRATFEEAWSRTFPGLRVQSVNVSDLSRLEQDVELDFSLVVPQFARPEAGGLSFTPFGQMRPYVESYAPLSARRYDLVLSYPWVNRFRHFYALPPQAEAGPLPPSVDVKSPFGHVKLAYRADAGKVIAEGEVAIEVSVVAAKDYAAFKAFLGEADAALQRRVSIGRAAARAVKQ